MKKMTVLFVAMMLISVVGIAGFTVFIFAQTAALAPKIQWYLYSITTVFAVLFMYTFDLSQRKFTRGRAAFYSFMMTITGYFVYLFLITIPLALLFSLYLSIGIPFPPQFATLALVIGLFAGLLGHAQAWFIQTKRITLSFPNLPEALRGKKIAIISDTHFGLVRRANFANYLVKKILKHDPLFVLHAGDFYDGPALPLEPITTVWKTLTEKVPVFYTSGNHEHYGDYEAFIASIKDANVTVLENSKLEYLGIEIGGITYHEKNQHEAAAQAVATLGFNPEKFSILLNHPPTFHDKVLAAGVNMMVSGHTHNGQFWPGTYFTRLIYGKYYYGKKMYGSLVGLTSRGVGTAGPPFRFLNPPEMLLITLQ